jgi:NADPH-dependent 2,4-dienoyl-CoA reductase/sulfur reductase-like enzyme/nitrite reductase/ring-hydroxylating ferredoxin subunit
MIPVLALSQLPAGHMHQVTVGDYDVLLANVDGTVFAIENKCSHYGFALTKGSLCEHRVRCPLHHACFDVRTGEQIEAPGMDGVPRFDTEVRDGRIFVGEQPSDRNEPLPHVRQGQEFGERPHDRYDYVIVGGGAAASYAIESIRARDEGGSLLVLSQESLVPYDRTKVSKGFLQNGMAPPALQLRDEAFYRRIGVDFRAGTQVRRVNLEEKKVTLESGQTIGYGKVLLATGGTPRRLTVPGANLERVFTIRSAGDAVAAREAVQDGTRVVIVGGSFIGLETAMSLGKRGGRITVVTPEKTLFENVFGERVGAYIKNLHEAEGVTFHLGSKLREINGDGSVSGVTLDDGTQLPADVVVVGIGVAPVTDYVEGIAYRDDGSLTTDSHLAIHGAAAFAAGDIATYPDREGMLRIEHWKVAAQQGRVAGRNMAGAAENYTMPPYFWSNQQGVNLRYVGHATDWSDIVFDGEPGASPFLAFYIKDGHVQACLGVKRDAEAAAINELMALGRMPSVDRLRGRDWLALCREVGA